MSHSGDTTRRAMVGGAMLLLLVSAAGGPGAGPAGGRGASDPGMPSAAAAAAARVRAPAAAMSPWIPVHPERKQRLIGAPIGEVCFDGTAPVKLAGRPPELPPASAYRRYGGVLVAHCLVDDEGYVVEAQLWKTPAPADRQAATRALAGWRFAPARWRDGRPAAVHFTVTIPIARQPDRR